MEPRRLPPPAPGIRSNPLLLGAVSYALVTLALYPIPLFNILHAESMLVIALASYFISSLAGLSLFRAGLPFGGVLVRQWLLLGIPAVLLTLTLLWIPNCGYLQGLLLFGLFPVITVVFGVAAAFAVHASLLRYKRLVLLVLGFGVISAGTAYDLLLHPQLYTYNHVYGGFLGPIYDEELAIRAGLFSFRGLTLLWAAFLVCVGFRWRAGVAGRKWSLRAGIVALGIGLMYLFSARLGFNTPEWYLQERLGSVYETENYAIYYERDELPEAEVARMAETAEFRYAGLREALGIDVPGRIRLYVFSDPDERAALTGARVTCVAPVWLRTPQIHMLHQNFDRSFAHELVHVFSREFGLPVINASLSIGLLEGLAVALDAPRGLPSAHAQVAAAAAARDDPEVYLGNIRHAVMRNLTASGFWGGRGAVSYTTMGSFVGFLLEAFGPEPLMQAYPAAAFETAYHVPLDTLVARWEAFIGQYPVTEEAGALMAARFAVPSLFEVRCPHFVPRRTRLTRRAARLAAAEDTTRAVDALERALDLAPSYSPALALWSEIQMGLGRPEGVIERFRRLDDDSERGMTLQQRIRLGDALAMAGRAGDAAAQFDTVRASLSPWAETERALVSCRTDLADRPDAIRALYASGGARKQAAGLAALPNRTPCIELFTAFRYADASQYRAAADHLDRAEAGSAAIRLRFGEILLRAREPAAALDVLTHVRNHYAAQAEPYRAFLACDRLMQAEWMLDGALPRESPLCDRSGIVRNVQDQTAGGTRWPRRD